VAVSDGHRRAVPARLGDRLRAVPPWVLLLFSVGVLLRVALTVAQRPAFLGFPDSQGYIEAAEGGLFDNSLRTGGYVLFLRAVHALSDHLTAAIAIQHLIGVATAAILYTAVRRAGGPAWAAALPAAVVLLGGTQLYLEHAPLSEPLFGLLVVAALRLAVEAQMRSVGSVPWLAAAGLLLGAAAVVRPAGALVAPAVALWAALALRPSRQAVVAAVVLLAVAAVPVAAYVIAQERTTGYTGITRSAGWTLYGRTAEFADCSRFDPPTGTRALCETTPTATRRAAADYLFDPAVSPAIQELGMLPRHDGDVGAFARAAILGDPLAYGRVVGRDLLRHFTPNSWVRQGMGFQTSTLVPYIHDPAQEERAIAAVARYWDSAGFARSNTRTFDAYANAALVEGPVAALLAALAVYGLIALRGRQRRLAALFAGGALALMLFPVATLSYDVRYATPAYGPLAAAAALGLVALVGRLRATTPIPSEDSGSAVSGGRA
jgi:hypothetical protein